VCEHVRVEVCEGCLHVKGRVIAYCKGGLDSVFDQSVCLCEGRQAPGRRLEHLDGRSH